LSTIGVDVGGTKVRAVRLDEGGAVATDPTQASPRDGPSLVAEIVASAGRLCRGTPSAVGVGVPGLVDVEGVVRFAPNLHGIEGYELAASLRAVLPQTSIWVGNDATAACWAEHSQGAGRGSGEVLMVTLGTGIGGGIVSGGRLIEGVNHYAGEFGHMVVDPHGPRCPCGKQGCWERFASGSGLGALGREMAIAGEAPRLVELAGGDSESVRGEHVTVAAAEGDAAAIEIMERFAWWVALGLANLANALDPEIIVLGGGLVSAGDVLLEPTRMAFTSLVEAPSVRGEIRIEPAALGVGAGAIGAALLAASAR
jgi:glucokinase